MPLVRIRHAPPPPKRRAKRALTVGILVVLAAGFINVARPLPTPTITKLALPATAALQVGVQWPANGEAALQVAGVGPLLENGQTPMATASIAKVITALTVLQKKPLLPDTVGDTITLTPSDVDLYNSYLAQDGSVLPVTAGQQLSEHDALAAMLLPSANNIADTFAIWGYGSMTAYRGAATQFVHDLGLTNTVIGSDASGFLPDTTSTPHDLVLLGEQAMQNPVIAQVVGMPHTTLPNQGTIYNVNSMLGDDGIVGIKTGNNNADPGAFLFAANYEVSPGHSVIIYGALLGAPSLRSAQLGSVPIINSAQAALEYVTPVRAGQTIATVTAPWGASASAVAAGNLSLVHWKGNALAPSASVTAHGFSSKKGAVLGTVSVTSNGKITETNAVLNKNLAKPSFWWRLTRY